MRSILLFITFFIMMFIDFSFANFGPFTLFGTEVYFVPKLLFMMLLLVSIYFGLSYGMFFSIVCGILLDVYIGTVYGIHLFGFVAFIIFMHTAFRVFYRDQVGLFFVVIVNTFLFDFYIYGIYKLINFINFQVFYYISLCEYPRFLFYAF